MSVSESERRLLDTAMALGAVLEDADPSLLTGYECNLRDAARAVRRARADAEDRRRPNPSADESVDFRPARFR